MNLILIIPPSPHRNNVIRMIDCSHEAKANYLWQPNDFLIISSLLARTDGIVLIDGTADAFSGERYFRELRRCSGDMIIFALSSVCWESDYRYFQQTRRLFPNTPFYVLGDIFLEESYRDLILNECHGVVFNPYQLDLRAMGQAPADSAARDLPGVCTVSGQKPFAQGKRTMTVESRTPRHEVFLKKGYRFPFAHHYRFTTVTMLWGCPFTCSYCSDANFPAVLRRGEDVLRELDAVAALGIRELFMADKVFGFAPDAQGVLEAMARTGRFGWSCYFHPQLYDARLLELMQRAGCHTIITGIDSADTASLRQYNRRVERGKIEQLVHHADRLGMNICADFILGLGHESKDDITRTIEYALDLPIDFASFNIAAPLPGSVIRAGAVSSGKLVFGTEGFDTFARRGILGNDNISSDDIRMLRKQAFARFYGRPSYLLRRLKRTRSLEHLSIQFAEMLAMIRKVGKN